MTETLYAVVPSGIDDPAMPSGGNLYDRRVLDGLARGGWRVVEFPVEGSWPAPDPADLHALDTLLVGVPSGSLVLVDGLVASGSGAVLREYAHRLRLVVLVHMPVGPHPDEGLALSSAAAVVVTSQWTRKRLRTWYGLRRVTVAVPGVDRVTPVRREDRRSGGTALLSVAAVHPGKGHDVLFEALSSLGDRAWTLTCAGSLEVDPDHVSALQTQVYARAWEQRVSFTGPLTGAALASAYDEADLLVLPSRSESYGMVVVEALAHGLPVLATEVGGVPEALGRVPFAPLPGILVPPDDADALADALRSWLDDPALRSRLASTARLRSARLRTWDQAVDSIESTLRGVSPVLPIGPRR